MSKITLRALPAALLAAFSGIAVAAGFQLMEQNASGLGVAYAGSAAVAENASTIYYNPAGLTLLPGRQVSLGVSGVGPSYRFRNQGSSTTGTLTTGGSDGGDAGGWNAVPNAYLSWQLAPKWYAGLGISSPFGLGTKYEDNNWVGRYQSLKADIKTVNFNPSLAYQLNDRLSLGFGLNYQRIDAEMSNFTPLGLSTLKGDDSAWGWNAGALLTLSPAMRVGLSYRSSMKYKLEGTQNVGLTSTPVTAKLELPDTVILSVWQQLSDRWEAMGDLSWTGWSTVDRLNIMSRNSGALLGSENFGYRNSWRFAWGAAYKYNDNWKLKFGLAYDRTPVSDGERSARVPDNDRVWLSLGAQWRPLPQTVVDLGYAYLYLRDAKINQGKDFGGGNTASLRGSYDAGAHVLGVQYTQGF